MIWSFMVKDIERLVNRQAVEEQVRQGSQAGLVVPIGDGRFRKSGLDRDGDWVE